MATFHSHGGASPAAGASTRRLLAALGVTATIMVAELVGGIWSHSLALVADAGHMLTDLLALGITYAAATFAKRPGDARRTYGYRRLEVLAALLNGMALVVVSVSIIYAAIMRWFEPIPIRGAMMIGVASAGLFANLLGLWLLHDHRGNLNVRGAFLHILGDTLSSVAVIVGGGIIMATGWTRIDPLLSLIISVVIMVTSYRLLREVIDVLLEAVPSNLSIDSVRDAMGSVAGVTDVHDLHIWSITSGMPALSAHVVLEQATNAVDSHYVLETIQTTLRERFDIHHATLQIEHVLHDNCGCEHL